MNDVWTWLGQQTGNILGVLGLIAGAWFYWLSRKPKRFGWDVVHLAEIINYSYIDFPMQVVINEETVTNPNLVVVRIHNLGKSEIRDVDFDGPIQIAFRKSRLVSVYVGSDTSLNGFTIEGGLLTFTPTLLNPGEWIELQIVNDGRLENPAIKARIAGLSGPMINVKRTMRRLFPRYLSVAGRTVNILLILLGGSFILIMLLSAVAASLLGA